MTHFIQEITSKINALPESMQQEVLAFIEIMHLKAARQAWHPNMSLYYLANKPTGIGLKRMMHG